MKNVYIVHHTNSGTPEANEIFGAYATEELAIAAMKTELDRGYDGTTLEENEDEDFEYMYCSEVPLINC